MSGFSYLFQEHNGWQKRRMMAVGNDTIKEIDEFPAAMLDNFSSKQNLLYVNTLLSKLSNAVKIYLPANNDFLALIFPTKRFFLLHAMPYKCNLSSDIASPLSKSSFQVASNSCEHKDHQRFSRTKQSGAGPASMAICSGFFGNLAHL